MNLLSFDDIFETINMIKEENLDIRTITMGISLYDCAADDVDTVCDRIYEKITTKAKDLVRTGCDIEKEYGIKTNHEPVIVSPVSGCHNGPWLAGYGLFFKRRADEPLEEV